MLVAGVASAGNTGALDYTSDFLRQDIEANYIGAILTTIAFVPLLQSSPKKAPAKILLLSSILGSAGSMNSLGPYAHISSGYAASKAAANMWYRKLALEFESGSAEKPRDGGWAVVLVSAVPPPLNTLDPELTTFLLHADPPWYAQDRHESLGRNYGRGERERRHQCPPKADHRRDLRPVLRLDRQDGPLLSCLARP